MNLLRGAWTVLHLELSLLWGFPRLRFLVPGIVVIPAVYAFIYLDSVWDPASRTGALPVAIVNLDEGAAFGGQQLSLGAELERSLRERGAFGFYSENSEGRAREAVRRGEAAFALVIPRGFSAGALSAAAPGAGKLLVFASEGNNYTGAGFARRFASELGHRVNETLNERRWSLVLGTTASSMDQLQRLHDGMDQLRQAAHQLQKALNSAVEASSRLASEAARYSEAVTQAAMSLQAAGASARGLDAKRPQAADLQALREGAQRVQSSQAELSRALLRLEEGARSLRAGMGELKQQADSLPLIGERLGDSLNPMLEGGTALQAGLRLAADASSTLQLGNRDLADGVLQLVDGVNQAAVGVGSLAARLPPDERLEEWGSGGRALADATARLGQALLPMQAGAVRLEAGLLTVAAALPRSLAGPDGTAGGLAASVEPQLDIDAPVANNGMGFLPNFIPVALWLGAVMSAFVFHIRRLPQAVADLPRLSLLSGKVMFLGLINLAQAACVLLMCQLLLGLNPVHATGLALTMAVSALTFMLLILFLVRLMGDLGKGVALVLLILQLSAAGGVMPVELASDFYGAISPWLPITWSVRGVRASAFGAFGSEWGTAVGIIVLFGAGFALLSLMVGRWQFVASDEQRMAIDI